MKCLHPHWTSRDIINSVTNKLSLARAMTASSAWHSAAFALACLTLLSAINVLSVDATSCAVMLPRICRSIKVCRHRPRQFFFQLSRFLHSIESLAGVLRTRLSVFHCLFKTNQTGTLSIWIHIECIWIDTSEVQSWLQDLVKNWQCGLRLRQMLALDLNTLAFSDCLSAEIILKYERKNVNPFPYS